ncbi:MAG: hypothetical protein ABWX58_11735, partial [Psychrobacillus psychrotolerans]
WMMFCFCYELKKEGFSQGNVDEYSRRIKKIEGLYLNGSNLLLLISCKIHVEWNEEENNEGKVVIRNT